MAIILSQQCGTDYSSACGTLRLSFMRMLAACIVGYTCSQTTQYRLNFLCAYDNCDDLSAYWTCSNNDNMDDERAERALVENVFALDACGNLGIKAFINLGAAG